MHKMPEMVMDEVVSLEGDNFEQAVMKTVVLYRKRTGEGLRDTLIFLRLRKAQMDWAANA